jgi:DNA-binding GntR family transcriptional regulator
MTTIRPHRAQRADKLSPRSVARESTNSRLTRSPSTEPAGRLSDRVAHELRRRIYTGVYRPGHHLVEQDLSKEFGVSRAPLREAVVTLEREGLVRISPYRGAVVARLDESDMIEIQQLRIALEGLAVRRVAATNDPEVIAAIRERLADMAAAVANGDGVALTDAHMDFHREIASGAGMPRAVGILDQLARQSHAFRSYATLSGPALPRVIDDHERLVEAIATGDPDVAHAAIVLHISARHEPIATLIEAGRAAAEED